MTPSLLNIPQGCAFHPRCPRADAKCLEVPGVTTPRQPDHHVRCFHPHLEGAA
jgi:peptide/nickel transport system ATP-binding protein